MTTQINYRCDQHPDPYDCPDNLVVYSAKFDEYGLIVHDDGGHSYVTVQFCPWCGAKSPEPKREHWFRDLEAKGFDDPLRQDIPDAYRSDAWYRKDKN
jgi:hypothetical protein